MRIKISRTRILIRILIRILKRGLAALTSMYMYMYVYMNMYMYMTICFPICYDERLLIVLSLLSSMNVLYIYISCKWQFVFKISIILLCRTYLLRIYDSHVCNNVLVIYKRCGFGC